MLGKKEENGNKQAESRSGRAVGGLGGLSKQ